MTSIHSGLPPAATSAGSAVPPGGLFVTVHHPRHGPVLVRAHGEVDLVTVDDLRRTLAGAVAGCPVPGAVVCDLSGVTFLAATGVAALGEADDAARRRGAVLHLVASTRPARRVLRLCGLDREVAVSDRLADVLGQAARRPPTPPAPGSGP